MKQELVYRDMRQYGKRGYAEAVYKLLLEYIKKAQKMGLYEMDITWENGMHEDDFEDDIERIVMSVDKKTHDTMFVTVYNLYDLDINRINQLFESDGFEIYHYKSPYVTYSIVGKVAW